MPKNNTPEIPRNRRTLYKAVSEVKDKNLSKVTCPNMSVSCSHGASMMESEFLQPQTSFRKKKYASSKQSMLPSQLALESIKETEARSRDMELKLCYNDYLQAIMLEHVTKKKFEEMKNAIIKQLTTISKQCEQDEEKLLKLKTRNRDLMNLSMAQQDVDTNINEINEYFGGNKIKTVQEIISHLCSILEPLNQLQCNNVILPEKEEEWLDLREALKECENTLGHIKKLISPNAEMYQAVYNGTKDFVSVYNDMCSYQQKFDKALYNLQILTTKYGSSSLE